MRRRFSLGKALASAVLLSLPVVACTDEPPTVSGGEQFPGGSLPATFQVTVPADSFVRHLGSYSGYTGPRDVDYQVVANRFEGALQANALMRLDAFPTTVNYTQGGTSKTDSVFTYGPGTLVARLDTIASTSAGPMELQLWEVGQEWHAATVSWTVAVDTTGGRTTWTQPGGTRAALLGRATLSAGGRSPGDSVVFSLDSVAVQRIAASGSRGVLITAVGAEGRVQISAGGVQLRTGVHPRNASPDTVVSVNVTSSLNTFVFDPEQPVTTDALQAGGSRSARTLLRVDLPATLPVCRGGDCTQVPTRSLTLNEVALLLRPVSVPGGFGAVGPVPITLRRVAEPELGRRAPLGAVLNEIVGLDAARRPVYGGSRFVSGDTLLAVPFTRAATALVAADSTRISMALLSDPGALFGTPRDLSFGAAWFSSQPRLRIVYTVPARSTLP